MLPHIGTLEGELIGTLDGYEGDVIKVSSKKLINLYGYEGDERWV
jgi:hypothetical protein